jgi:ribosomal protein S18 acetylase RimI-like enzyme
VNIEIRPAAFPRDLELVRGLFREYADGLGVDLCFQDFDAELAGLPGEYSAPAGRLLLAWRGDAGDGETPVGCVALRAVGGVALRAVGAGTCEMKRLYLRPGLRGMQLGRRLAERIVAEARAAGYARICLDTLPSMSAAIGLYTALGFKAIEPYVYNPIPGALFLGLEL